MSEKKNLLLNCDLCDTRKMKEEDYSHYEHIVINTDVLLVTAESKSILSRLPVTINNDSTIELEDGEEVYIKSVNGSYEITGNSSVAEHTILSVNGSLFVHPGTEEILKKYDEIVVNGSVRYPKSLEGFLGKMNVNGATDSYPDDCVMLDSVFTIDKYFPLRAREGSKYYVGSRVIIKDESVDITRLVEKKVHFETKRLLVLESKIEDSVPLFDESVDFIVIPNGMKLIDDDIVLNEEFIRNEGSRLFIYGDVKVDKKADMNALRNNIEKLIIKGTVSLRSEQEEAFRSMNVEFDNIKIKKDNRKIVNVVKAKLDKKLFDDSPKGIEVHNVAKLKIKDDVTSEMILEKLVIRNCAKVDCSEELESAVAAVSENVAIIGKASDDEEGAEGIGGILGDMFGGAGGILGDIAGGAKKLLDTKLINADNYVM